MILPEDEHTETESTFVVEMAPLELMPHSVHIFLEQVRYGLWSSAWFYVNGPHVLQCGPHLPHDYDADSSDDHHDEAEEERLLALKPFQELDLETLSFAEYSHQYPHQKWTLGFTGRPGGPDWYINKVRTRRVASSFVSLFRCLSRFSLPSTCINSPSRSFEFGKIKQQNSKTTRSRTVQADNSTLTNYSMNTPTRACKLRLLLFSVTRCLSLFCEYAF